ncbi:MAG: radical SAM family heme chaperone HemW [Dehalococcoidia bacterium]
MNSDLSVYLHIPFCDTKCAYCDFNSYAGIESLIPAYTRALCREAELWSPAVQGRTVQTVFFGGGTPSLLPLAEMGAILQTVRDFYQIGSDVELSLEANPGTVDEEHLRGLRKLGFNRISIGVQSFDDGELRALDRIHSGYQAIAAFSAARAAGFDNINLDLIYGLAGQSLAGWAMNISRAIELLPEHLSLYALTVEEGTALAYQIALGVAPAPDPDLQADMYELTQERLAKVGYVQYEISNWALPGHACRHNLTYWRNGQWLGLGAGAHSCLGALRFSDALSPNGYIHRVARASGFTTPLSDDLQDIGLEGSMPQIVWQERIEEAMAISDSAILGLRLCEGLSLTEFRKRFGRDLFAIYGEKLRECSQAGLLELDGDCLRLTNRGLLLSNEGFTRLLPPEQVATALPIRA